MTRARATYVWTIGVILLTFVEAVWRLGARAVETMQAGLVFHEWVLLALIVGLFVYGEGYRALALRFAPRIVARAHEAAALPGVWAVLSAPLYALSLIRAPKRALAHAWGGVALVIVAVVAVRDMPEPWRGMIDAGVAAALSFGTVALLRLAIRR